MSSCEHLSDEVVLSQDVIDRFWEQNGSLLEERIAGFSSHDELFGRYKNGYGDLDVETFRSVFLAHERAFVDHILNRLVSILNRFRERYGDEDIIFNIHTSMLYDVDHTFYESFLQIRPSARLLFEFILQQFSGVKLGVVSTREQKDLDRQVVDPDYDGSLVEIADCFEAGFTGVYAKTSGSTRNKDVFDSRPYPDWQPENDLNYVLAQRLGVPKEEADRICDEEFPVLVEAVSDAERYSMPQLYFQDVMEQGIDRAYFDNRSVMQDINCKELQGVVIAEILSYADCMARALDARQDDAFEIIVEEILESTCSEFTEEQRTLFVPAIRESVEECWDYVSDVVGCEWSLRDCKVPEDLGFYDTFVCVARYKTRKFIENLGVGKFMSMNDGDSSGFRQLSPVWDVHDSMIFDEEGPSIMHLPFRKEIGQVFRDIQNENQKYKFHFPERIAALLGLDSGDDGVLSSIDVSLQRIAACLRELEEGNATVVIAIDNELVAERMDQLFQGNIFDERGEIVDPFMLFGIPEEYRDRIYLIHVGKGAEYSQLALDYRFKQALAA